MDIVSSKMAAVKRPYKNISQEFDFKLIFISLCNTTAEQRQAELQAKATEECSEEKRQATVA